MQIPFLHYFLKAKERFRPAPSEEPTASVMVAPLGKPDSDRLRKTVMPNSTRVLAPSDALNVKSGSASGSRGLGLPPAVVLALEPAVERTISLDLADVVSQIPKDYLKPDQAPEPGRRVVIKASAVEKGMATAKPSVLLSAVYEQVPDIFAREVAPSDSHEVSLPYEKVLEQFNTARVREDQQHDPNVPQVETPILKVTIEDTERFGTKMEPLQGATLPPVKVEPATAKSIAEAEPETVVKTTAPTPRPNRSTIPLSQTISLAAEPPKAQPKSPEASSSSSPGPAKIPFNLPPNGTGAPASERVPASSGPSVPPPAAPAAKPSPLATPPIPAPPLTASPAGSTPILSASVGRLATKGRLKVTPPSDDLRPKLTLVPGVERKGEKVEEAGAPTSAAAPAVPAPPVSAVPPSVKSGLRKDLKIAIPLRQVLEAVPPFQLHGDVENVPAEARVEFPFSLVQPQLATGRIAISPKVFRDAMPEALREFFVVDDAETPVLLPLQEVLKNLPEDALKMRSDQVHFDVGEMIETPFSIKAKEDAARFGNKLAFPSGREPVKIEIPEEVEFPKKAAPSEETKPVEEAKVSEEAKLPEAAKPVAEAELPPSLKIEEPKKEHKFDAREAVACATALAGVRGCSVTFSDGLIVAQEFPAEASVEGFCAAAPSLRQRIEQHTRDTTLGALTSMTLQGEKSAVSLFLKGNICLTVLHSVNELAADVRTKLAEMAEQLTQTYAQPEPGNVDH